MGEIKLVKIEQIKLNPNNPRLIKDDKFKKLVQSIVDFPQMLEIRPIVVNADMIILGGNMRYKACKEVGIKEIPVIIADNLTEEQQKEFLIKDNVSGGEWDLGTDFTLPDGDKAPFQQMTFTLADEQAEQIKNAIDDIKKTDEYKYAETMGNENSNGNALYLIVMQWAEQRR